MPGHAPVAITRRSAFAPHNMAVIEPFVRMETHSESMIPPGAGITHGLVGIHQGLGFGWTIAKELRNDS